MFSESLFTEIDSEDFMHRQNILLDDSFLMIYKADKLYVLIHRRDVIPHDEIFMLLFPLPKLPDATFAHDSILLLRLLASLLYTSNYENSGPKGPFLIHKNSF